MNGERAENWVYENTDRTHIVRVGELRSGLLELRTKGVVQTEGCRWFVERIRVYVGNRKSKVRILSDDTHVERITSEAREVAALLVEEGSGVEKIASFGDNAFMRTFFNIYTVIADIPVRAFSSRERALEWLDE